MIPVLVLDGDGDWAALAETFVGAGLAGARGDACARRTRWTRSEQMSQVPGAIVGAGTVLNEAQLAQAIDAGSRFIVSPGLTNPLALAARDTGVAFLPGIATAGDIMRGLDLGLDRFKFFPAEASGGIAGAEGAGGAFLRRSILPDRRDPARQRRRLARARCGTVRRRNLAVPGTAGQS